MPEDTDANCLPWVNVKCNCLPWVNVKCLVRCSELVKCWQVSNWSVKIDPFLLCYVIYHVQGYIFVFCFLWVVWRAWCYVASIYFAENLRFVNVDRMGEGRVVACMLVAYDPFIYVAWWFVLSQWFPDFKSHPVSRVWFIEGLGFLASSLLFWSNPQWDKQFWLNHRGWARGSCPCWMPGSPSIPHTF